MLSTSQPRLTTKPIHIYGTYKAMHALNGKVFTCSLQKEFQASFAAHPSCHGLTVLIM